jgi:mono/diheme cytochrome c family protein
VSTGEGGAARPAWWRRPWFLWLVVVIVAGSVGAVLSPEWSAALAGLAVASWGVSWLLTRRLRMGQVVAALAAVAVVLLLAQLVPYGRSHANAAGTGEPAWDSAATRDLAARACFDCHSNETAWPWYTNVAPISWVTQRHVDEGRAKLNFSEYDQRRGEADEAVETVREGSMPLFDYTLVHSTARLTDAEKQALADGLFATLGR